MAKAIPAPPTSFTGAAHGGRWWRWKKVYRCFWPRRSGASTRSRAVDPVLADVRFVGGVYFIAWSATAPSSFAPSEAAVAYMGETSEFRRRMEQFANSAGIMWDKRYNGHSAGWRWPEGESKHLWVAFFPVPPPHGMAHLGIGMRKWLEAVALEEHRRGNGDLPLVNASDDVVTLPRV